MNMKISIASEKIEDRIQIINTIKVLNESECSEIKNSFDNLYLIDLIGNYFKIAKNNYQDFIYCIYDFIPETIDEIDIPTIFDRMKLDELKIESNRKLLNYLSSFKTLLDHIFGILDDEKEIKFKKFTNYLYDENFSYRFLARLRDFAQHKGLPITNFESDFSTSLVYIFLMIDSNYLLNSYKKWNTVRKDLEKYNKIDAISIVTDHYKLLDQIYKFLFQLYEDDLKKSVFYIEDIINKFKGDYRLILLKENDNSNETKMEYFPIKVIEEVKKNF